MFKRLPFLIFLGILIIVGIACNQTGSSPSGGNLQNIACALQGIPPEDCDNGAAPSGGLADGSSGNPGALTPSPSPTLVRPPTATPAPTPVSAARVVYGKDGSIWYWDGGSKKQITSSLSDTAPKISDDGLRVVYQRNGALWAINSDGTSLQMLISASALASVPHTASGAVRPGQYDFAPRSHIVYFNTIVVDNKLQVPDYDLFLVNADEPSPQLLLNGEQGAGQFVFSPDGARIALARKDSINIVKADGSELKSVFTFPAVMPADGKPYIPEIVWLADGSGFVTVIPAPDNLGSPAGPARLMFISAEGGQVAQLAEFNASPIAANRPFIAPNGSKVLYTKVQEGDLELHVIDAGTADKMYFRHAASSFGILGWTPDSTGVVFWVDDKRASWLGSLADSKTEPLNVDVAFADKVTWVDSTSYLFMNELELRICIFGQPSILIDTGVNGGFDSVVPIQQ